MNLGKNIQRIRKMKGWSQTQLAEKVGCHASNVTRIETGKYTPGLETVAKIADILEVSIDHLINSTAEDQEEIRFKDHTFVEKIKLLETLEEHEQVALQTVIDAMLTKKRVLKMLQGSQ